MKICDIEDCNKKQFTRGWCAMHYQRWWKYGDVNVVMKNGRKKGIPLSVEHRKNLSIAKKGTGKGNTNGFQHGHSVNLTHGYADTPVYKTWASMIQRTTNPNTIGYHNYGGRGITICDEWLRSFEAFLAHVGERPEGTSIDRIDNDGNYEPGNVRWATPKQQAGNRRARYG